MRVTKLLSITNAGRGTTVCDRARLAETSRTRLLGLLGEQGLAAGEGLWITPSSGVHTWGMSFAIDVVALDAHLRVVAAVERVGPWRLAGLSWKTRSVLELPAGQIERAEIAVGDTLEIREATPPEVSAA